MSGATEKTVYAALRQPIRGVVGITLQEATATRQSPRSAGKASSRIRWGTRSMPGPWHAVCAPPNGNRKDLDVRRYRENGVRRASSTHPGGRRDNPTGSDSNATVPEIGRKSLEPNPLGHKKHARSMARCLCPTEWKPKRFRCQALQRKRCTPRFVNPSGGS